MFTPRYHCPCSIKDLNKGLNRLLREFTIKEVAQQINRSVEWIEKRLTFKPEPIHWRFGDLNYITDFQRRFEIFRRPDDSLTREEYLYRKSETYLITGGNPYKYFGVDNKTEDTYGADTVESMKSLMNARYGVLQFEEAQ